MGWVRTGFTAAGSDTGKGVDASGHRSGASESPVDAEGVPSRTPGGEESPGCCLESAKALLDILDDLVFVLDERGTIRSVNTAAARALGFPGEQLEGMGLGELHTRCGLDEGARILQEMLSGRITHGMMPVVSQSGEVLELEARVSRGFWEEEPAFLVVCRDASDRVRDRRQLDESRTRLELALKGADLGMWDWNIPAGEVFYGDRWARILGYSPGEVEPDMSFWERLVHPEDKGHVRELIRNHLKGASPGFECEYRLWTRSGRWKWILAKGRVTERDSDGRALRMTGTYMDITQRKEAELALRLFRQIIEHTSEAIAIRDRKGRLVYTNPAHEALFGHPFHEAVCLDQHDHHPPEAVQILMNEVLPRLYRGEGWEGELEAFDSLGRRFVLWERADAICDEDGNVLYTFGIMHDVSDQKAAEARRLDMERRLLLSEKRESLGAMASAVAHHFNNLLMGVLGNLELLQDLLDPEGRGPAILGQAQRAARRASELSRVMMTYMGQGVGIRTMQDVSTLVSSTLPLVEDSPSDNVSWKTRLARDLPRVMVDADALRQVLINLAHNAVESLDGGDGTISVSTGTLFCDEYCLESKLGGDALPPGEYVYIEMADNGCGMSSEVVSRMFDPFFSTKFTGRGLGLASVLGIVRAHEGAIEVMSEPGQGARVRILLPAAAQL